MDFEWDEGKRRANFAKHGVDFEAIVRLFEGPTLERIDDRHAYGEERYVAIGVVAGEELTVVYTWRGNSSKSNFCKKGTPQ